MSRGLMNYYDGGIPPEIYRSPAYQKVLKQLQKHYGFRVVLHSYEQAVWWKAEALRRLSKHQLACDDTESIKDIIASDFAMMVHRLIFGGMSADEITMHVGSFEKYLHTRLEPNTFENIFRVAIAFCDIENSINWWEK